MAMLAVVILPKHLTFFGYSSYRWIVTCKKEVSIIRDDGEEENDVDDTLLDYGKKARLTATETHTLVFHARMVPLIQVSKGFCGLEASFI